MPLISQYLSDRSPTDDTTSARETRPPTRRRSSDTNVPLISVTSLYNRLQTSGLVVLDCRSYSEFRKSHLPNALHCDNGHWKHSASLDDFVTRSREHNHKLVKTLRHRDLLEIVVIASGSPLTCGSGDRGHCVSSDARSGLSWFYRLDWSYRLAKSLLREGRVFSVKLLAQNFQLFQTKYDFLLRSDDHPTSIPTVPLTLDSLLASSHSRVPSPPGFAAPTTSAAPALPSGPSHPAPTVTPPQQPVITSFPSEILDEFMFLGNFWQANSRQVIDALGITHIVNVGAITEERNRFDDVQYLDLMCADKENVDIGQQFTPSVQFIQRARKAKGRVLIHCVQGISRSSTIAIWYLMLTKHCTLSAAYDFVLKRRPLIFPNQGFMKQLIAKEKELYGEQSVEVDELELLQNGLLPAIDRKGSLLVVAE